MKRRFEFRLNGKVFQLTATQLHVAFNIMTALAFIGRKNVRV